MTLTPLEIKAEELPAVDQLDIHDCIYCFPAGSGLPPIYAVFSESLDSGKFSRKQLDKKFKHANSFGVTDTRKNIETLSKFRDAVNEHLADVDTSPHGTYQRETDSTVFSTKEQTMSLSLVAMVNLCRVGSLTQLPHNLKTTLRKEFCNES